LRNTNITYTNHAIDEASLQGYNQRVLETVKPVLRKQTIHNAKNVVLFFKSIEVQLVSEKFNKQTGKIDFKFLSPMYVPVHYLEHYMFLDKSLLEIQLLKSIYEESPGNFVFIDERDLKGRLD